MLEEIGRRAKQAAAVLGQANGGVKNLTLALAADALERDAGAILEANAQDMAQADANGISEAMQDRLLLTRERIAAIASAMRYITTLTDPVGQVLGGDTRPNGLKITKISVPLGVVGVIYESRPNVTADIAALCIKSGNACILRGGKEAIHSNRAIAQSIRGALEEADLPADCVQLIQDTTRESAKALMELKESVDLLIPRGGAGLIRSVVENAKVPVVETGAGNCHIFVDESADLEMAVEIVNNAKTSRPSVCNAVETVLVHGACAQAFLPWMTRRLEESRVELRACEVARQIIPQAKPAAEEDWGMEYDDYILAVKVVKDLTEAMEHIERYSTRHSESIITESYANAAVFTGGVDSAAVYVNASTRFTDGEEFGLGAEIGISTQKLHARGPMGLAHLTTCKYIIQGSGQIR